MIGLPARFAELVRRTFGEEEIQPPGIVLENDRPEYSVLKNEVPIFHLLTSPAVAAQVSEILITQQDKTRLTVITDVLILDRGGATQGVKLSMTTGLHGLTAGVRFASRDFRKFSTSTMPFTGSEVADPFPTLTAITVTAFQSLPVLRMPWMLGVRPDGTIAGLMLSGASLNIPVSAWFFGYERGLDPAERVLD